jgi:hypothetical protein
VRCRRATSQDTGERCTEEAVQFWLVRNSPLPHGYCPGHVVSDGIGVPDTWRGPFSSEDELAVAAVHES